ncbi:MAG: hypothetical protein CM15mP92_2130 [Halieaceae bacterium]|nr:MAG: hypothetical protein CM15mP92_2130 [Halieaceae bacterium]
MHGSRGCGTNGIGDHNRAGWCCIKRLPPYERLLNRPPMGTKPPADRWIDPSTAHDQNLPPHDEGSSRLFSDLFLVHFFGAGRR